MRENTMQKVSGIVMVLLLSITLVIAPVGMAFAATEWDYKGISAGVDGPPSGISEGPDGKLYILDQNSANVQVYNQDLTDTGTTYALSNSPAASGIEYYNGNWYVVDPNNDRITEYDTSFSSTGNTWDVSGMTAVPTGIERHNGDWFLIGTQNNNLFRLDDNFNQIGSTSIGGTVGQANGIDAQSGNLYIGGGSDARVYKYDASDLSYTGVSYDLSSEDSDIRGIGFSEGWYAGGDSTDSVYAYTYIPETSTVSGVVRDKNGNPVENVTVETETGVSNTTNSNGEYALELADGNYNITASKKNYKPQEKEVSVVGSDKTVNFEIEKIESKLSIEGPNFVRPNQTIPYSVEYTNESGTYDVTDYTNVTSGNTTLLTVDETNRTMVAGQYNSTVIVSADYNTTNVSANTTKKYYVSYLKLSNIDTVPPAKWIQAFLGFDDGYAEGQNMEGIGSDMQWLLFIVIIMSTFAKVFDNPWAGIGSGMVTGILLWVLEYIGLGLLLSTVFFGIFVGLILVRVRRDGGNEVTINEG